MKIVVSVNELSTETQMVIDNMRRSHAPVLIGDPNKPMAVLLSLEEYERLLRETQKAAALETTQPIARPAAAAPERPAIAEGMPVTQPAAAEVIPAAQHSDIVQRTAAAIQADRTPPPEPKIVSQRQTTLQPDPTLPASRPAPLRNARPSKSLPKPPRPLQTPNPHRQVSLAAIPGGWQTIALAIGVLALGVLGFALIVNAIGG